ncbi:NAD(P)H-binding protein [Amycolatopsis suaedae]|uniref:NAD-dependent epimerase/dehydratase family protein n=1 Tax=Amycolatopsis suaedae TaxID=2510978 RepID=A0A4Q7JFL0_9PSEU|nr:NAD(P)H-binding protein [Amycolatopsis suaedae]RZQ66036.1 NAD-dependent epimerase/dehydratase family protein [Amycolatopsis suaedae]
MRILVTGATGNVGRLVVNHLLAAGANVRALTNDPKRAALPDGVEVVEGFLGRPDSVRPALAGVERMYLAPYPRTAPEVLAMAKEAGVRRVVDFSSAQAVDEAERDPSTWYFLAVEKAAEASGLEWTHIRAGEFMTNTLDWAEQIRTTGIVRKPHGRAATAIIDMDDIAAAAATVLLEDGHGGKLYNLTGPAAVPRVELARQIGAAIGREVPFEEQPREEALAEMRPFMGDFAEWYVDGMAALVDNPEPVTPDFTRITGRTGTTFAEWAARNADSFR